MIPGLPGWCPKRYVSCIATSITNKKLMLIFFSQAWHNTNKSRNKAAKLKTRGTREKKPTFATKYEHPLWPQLYSTKSHSGMELWWNWVWSQWKVEQDHLYLKVVSRWNNVKVANWRASTIMVHVTCSYPILWEIIYVTYNCAPIQGVLWRFTL